MTKKRSSLRRRLLIGLAITAISVEALWLAIHHVPGFGPALADGVRSVFGPGVVAWAEDTAYGIEDQLNRWRYKDAAPKTLWDTPPASELPAPSPPPSAVAAASSGAPQAGAAPGSQAFPPPTYEPPFANVAAQGDGVWIAMPASAGSAESPPLMFKSAVHPDPKRSFAVVAVVAVDLSRQDLHLVSGTLEPFSVTVAKERRQGVVNKDDLPDLVAAFNGGFKATHGHYGMMINGDTYLPPRDIACTVAMFKDGSIGIRTWTEVKDQEASMAAYRQTPPCLVEEGELNDKLSEYNKNWGATVSGETVIRRSAVGIDKTGKTLFYALGEAVTAQAMGRAMKAAGAVGAAQLDVNYAYPRFLLFERAAPDSPPIAGSPLIPGIDFDKQDYTVQPSPRDFFYITRKRPAARTGETNAPSSAPKSIKTPPV